MLRKNSKRLPAIEGFMDRNATLQAIREEKDDALLRRLSYDRLDHLRQVEAVVVVFTTGDRLSVILRRFRQTGTLLGYRCHKYRGWVMGVLLPSGLVKEFTIDPIGYDSVWSIDSKQEPGRDRVYIYGLKVDEDDDCEVLLIIDKVAN